MVCTSSPLWYPNPPWSLSPPLEEGGGGSHRVTISRPKGEGGCKGNSLSQMLLGVQRNSTELHCMRIAHSPLLKVSLYNKRRVCANDR